MSPEEYVVRCVVCTTAISDYEDSRKSGDPESYLCWTPLNSSHTLWDCVNAYCGKCRQSSRYPREYMVCGDTPISAVHGNNAVAQFLRITDLHQFTPAALKKLASILSAIAKRDILKELPTPFVAPRHPMKAPNFEVIDESTQPTFVKEDKLPASFTVHEAILFPRQTPRQVEATKQFVANLHEAFAQLEAPPAIVSKDNLPHTASFIDDDPANHVQLCDVKGGPLMEMPLEDYEAMLKLNVSMGCTVRNGCPQEDYETAAIQASYDMGPLQGPVPTRILTPSFVHTQSEQGPEGCPAGTTPQEGAGSSDHPKGGTLPSEPSDSASITAYLQKALDKVNVAKILEEAVREEEDIGTILPLDPRQAAQEVIAGTVTPLVPPRHITLDIDWKLKF